MRNIESVLVDHGVSVEDIDKAKVYRSRAGGNIEKVLLNMGSVSEELIPSIYSQLLGAPILTSDQIDAWQPVESQPHISEGFLLQNGWVVFASEKGEPLHFATFAPLNWDVVQYLSQEGISFQVIIVSEADFGLLNLKCNDVKSVSSDQDMLSDLEEERLREMASEAPTVNLLNSLISRALRMQASDMHVEPAGGRYRVRFRIDGVLHDVDTLPRQLQLPIISRLKILAGMDIAEKRRPQDGKIEMRIANTDLDVRVSTLPVNQGESMVLRFLRTDALRYDLTGLGLPADTLGMIKNDLGRTSGVILLTGPTGSGKTTTLYSFLNHINSDDVKIITLEDPVEYQLPGLNQVHVKPDIGFDFGAGLRSVVRQDPDVIMVGEIRDKETCQIAMQAALTGHLVFSTVHTNDSASAFTRLLDLGVEEFLLNAALVSIIAQRLVRKLCDKCAVPADNQEELAREYELKGLAERFGLEQISLKSPGGCESCGNTGYRGRIAVLEYLSCDDQLKAIPKDDQFITNAKAAARQAGARDLKEDGLLKAMQGLTTIDEVFRVCG
jgi:general secretion pathway protein E